MVVSLFFADGSVFAYSKVPTAFAIAVESNFKGSFILFTRSFFCEIVAISVAFLIESCMRIFSCFCLAISSSVGALL